ncbi:MAG TPA: Holliday junction branch migration protein RuvA [Limnochordia bacterium]|nr:Holliday junction branch migration protein RuvA [Limnochordia bacterium]
MIRQLRGEIWSARPGEWVVGAGGVGYHVHVPVGAAPPGGGAAVTLHVHTHVREDAIQLFGFVDPAQLELFERVIEVSGVGPRLGLAVLSALTPERFTEAVQRGEHTALTRVPGVGRKTAERLILELRDRLRPHHAAAPSAAPAASDVEAALMALGYTEAEVKAAVAGLSGAELAGDPAAAVRRALSLLRRRTG